MKNKKILALILSFLFGIFLFSCSDNSDEETISRDDDDIPVFVDLRNSPLPDGLSCYLYIFSKTASASDYTFYANYTMTGAQARIKLMNKDLANNTYRFLFIATSSDSPEVRVLSKNGVTLKESNKWEDVMLRANNDTLSADNYLKILDKSGTDILKSGNIQGTLSRLVGQMTFDIYKVKSQGEEYQNDEVILPHYSVLDRVYKIEIEYIQRTKDIVFNAANQPVQHSLWSGKYIQTIKPKLLESTTSSISDMRIDTNQITRNLILSSIAKGSASLKGIYCMPSVENMKVGMKFYYYGTTPVCGEIHSHDKNCFTEDTIRLNLPKQNAGMKLLSIKPNHYTVNTAKIRFNRIIDVGATAGFIFDTMWENEK